MLLLFISTACNQVITEKKQLKEKSGVKGGAENWVLTKTSLPLFNNCSTDLPVYENVNLQDIAKDIPANLKFGGVLKESKNYLAILLIDTFADSQIHYLTTISKEGKIIDKFNLYSGNCLEDEFFWEQSDYRIDQELIIIQTDSSAKYKRDAEGEVVKESIKGSLHKYKLYVDEEGRIKKYGT